jgi:hypothetical protein
MHIFTIPYLDFKNKRSKGDYITSAQAHMLRWDLFQQLNAVKSNPLKTK